MLDYSKFDCYRTLSKSLEDFAKQEEKFEEAKALYALKETDKRIEKANKKQEEIDNLTYEKGLILQNALDVIREDINQSYYNIFRYLNIRETLWLTWKYAHFKKENRLEDIEKDYKKDKKYNKPLKDYKVAFDFVVDTVKDRLIPEKYRKKSDLIKIIDCNHSTQYEFTFKYKNIEYGICIPMFINANQDNYLELLGGYALRFKDSEYCISRAFNTLSPREFREKLEGWITDRLKKEKKKEVLKCP